jgi:hypothetical protein
MERERGLLVAKTTGSVAMRDALAGNLTDLGSYFWNKSP